jgi:hypothetical protein
MIVLSEKKQTIGGKIMDVTPLHLTSPVFRCGSDYSPQSCDSDDDEPMTAVQDFANSKANNVLCLGVLPEDNVLQLWDTVGCHNVHTCSVVSKSWRQASLLISPIFETEAINCIERVNKLTLNQLALAYPKAGWTSIRQSQYYHQVIQAWKSRLDGSRLQDHSALCFSSFSFYCLLRVLGEDGKIKIIDLPQAKLTGDQMLPSRVVGAFSEAIKKNPSLNYINVNMIKCMEQSADHLARLADRGGDYCLKIGGSYYDKFNFGKDRDTRYGIGKSCHRVRREL